MIGVQQIRKHARKIDRTELDYLIPIIFNFFFLISFSTYIEYLKKKKKTNFYFLLVKFLIVFVQGSEKPTIEGKRSVITKTHLTCGSGINSTN